MATAAFFVLGISAWHLARAPKDDETRDAFRRSFQLGAVYAFVATLAVMVVGHTQAQYMIRVQPMKMAAAEALWESANPAPHVAVHLGRRARPKGRLRAQGRRGC